MDVEVEQIYVRPHPQSVDMSSAALACGTDSTRVFKKGKPQLFGVFIGCNLDSRGIDLQQMRSKAVKWTSFAVF